MTIAEATECPKCGGTSGFSCSDYFSGYAECISKWDLSDADYPQFADTVITRRLAKTVICLDCGKRISRPTYIPNNVNILPSETEGEKC